MSQNVIRQGSCIFLKIRLNSQDRWYYYDEKNPPLGEGAMGTVYLGYSHEDRTPVAIKKVKDAYSNNPEIRKRARLEAELMFRHHNLVEMLGYCEIEPMRGPIFIISKFVNGQNFDTFVKNNLSFMSGDSKALKICQMMLPIFDALEYLHSYDIVHMDIKPSNIMIENGNNIRLMDLGIAFIQDKLQLSSSMGIMGTPKYAAPEQFGSEGTPVDRTTDIYELGVTLYEMLTGTNPLIANSISETLQKRKTLLLGYSPQVPNSIIDVLRKATAYEQQNRFSTVGDFKRALLKAMYSVKNKPKSNIKIVWIFVAVILIILFLMILILTL